MQVNQYISSLKDEIEKEEQRVLKENLKKLEMKKKKEVEKIKPFELKTDKRNIGKQLYSTLFCS